MRSQAPQTSTRRVARAGATLAALALLVGVGLARAQSASPQRVPTGAPQSATPSARAGSPGAMPLAPATAQPPVLAPAAGDDAPWAMPLRLLEGDDSAWRLDALTALAVAVRVRTSVETATPARPVAPRADALFATPVLFWSARDAATPPPDARVALAQFLAHGGLLVVDGDATRDAAFLASAEAIVRDALPPESTLGPLRERDILLHTFYLVASPQGRGAGEVRAARVGGNVVALVSGIDLLGSLAPGQDAAREPATRFLVNLVMYALCLDYKDDQVHAPFLMRRRRGAP